MQGLDTFPATVNRFQACMLLAAVGDAMGYKNGDWQFNTSSILIHKQMQQITNNKGPLYLKIGLDWRYSDDTVMHIATALALTSLSPNASIETIGKSLAVHYKLCWSRMSGRAPGKTCGKSISILEADGSNWDHIPFSDKKGGGCGASMRSACIGLVYANNVQKLVGVAIEAGRITHHNPIGYLGSMVSAYFTSLAIKGVPPEQWAAWLFEQAFPIAKQYIISAGRQVKLNLQSGQWEIFIKAWQDYCQKRNISTTLQQISAPIFPAAYGIIEREHFYKQIAWGSWPGALGIDSVLIAYDALLGGKGSWEELCLRAVLHGGDNDSTGTIAGAWFGAIWGLKGVPKCHIIQLEDHVKLGVLGERLYKLSKTAK